MRGKATLQKSVIKRCSAIHLLFLLYNCFVNKHGCLKDPNLEYLAPETDVQASSRKEDHIDLAFASSTPPSEIDPRFYYEPMLSGHNTCAAHQQSITIGGKKMQQPIWVSSMTGGTEKAITINRNLAKLCGVYGLGMGLGSCRQLLYEDKRLVEFDIRALMPKSPLFINLGIAQVETLLANKETELIDALIAKLDADGLIIHVNPLQEWLQPEGDIIKVPPIETVQALVESATYPIIVKEVGQGFGKESLRQLLALPLEAIDLAGYGGTNFSKLELLRSDPIKHDNLKPVCQLGHTCEEMITIINDLKGSTQPLKSPKIIISGGIKNFLDGYYHMSRCQLPSIYAQASGFLKYAMDYEALNTYCHTQIEGLKMAKSFLRLKSMT